MSKRISVIIPTLNEAQGIALTICDIIRELNNPDILVIDADSVDGTPQIAAHLGAKVLRQFPVGKGSAIAKALRYVNKKTKWLVLVDGDYSDPVERIPHMIRALEKDTKVGMVTGKQKFPAYAQPRTFLEHVKKLIAEPYYSLHSILKMTHHIFNGVSMEDPLSGMRVIRYDSIKDFQPRARGFDIEIELNCYVRSGGYEIVEIPVEKRRRLGRAKFQRLRHGLTIFMRMIVMMLMYRIFRKGI